MKIYIIDSGVGGIKTLGTLRRLYPNFDYVYFADNKNCPYGKKTEEEIKNFVISAIEGLNVEKNDKLIIACNTATVSSLNYIRENYPFETFGIMPNSEFINALYGKTLFLATDRTIDAVKPKLNSAAVCFSPDGLPKIIENSFGKSIVAEKIEEIRAAFSDLDLNNIYLGCTHFSLVKDKFEKAFGKFVRVIDCTEVFIDEISPTLDRYYATLTQRKGSVTYRLSLPSTEKMLNLSNLSALF